ncbi:MAG TPA: PHP domain-containing protein [Desulfobacterales bacterium]|nr:PHP domain-containing protein [Desulfobacterales bacterium]
MMDLHTHTQFSDGVGFIHDNVASAEERSLSMVGISDHIHYFTPKKSLIGFIGPKVFAEHLKSMQ